MLARTRRLVVQIEAACLAHSGCTMAGFGLRVLWFPILSFSVCFSTWGFGSVSANRERAVGRTIRSFDLPDPAFGLQTLCHICPQRDQIPQRWTQFFRGIGFYPVGNHGINLFSKELPPPPVKCSSLKLKTGFQRTGFPTKCTPQGVHAIYPAP